MALRRYRHFWSSALVSSAVDPYGDRAGADGDFTERGDLYVATSGTVDAADLTSIIKAYNPPEFAREVRQVQTGKVMNERILGRLDPEATNFSVTLPSDFEIFYGYNQDYRFEIEEELHANDAANVRLVEDIVEGTMFRREWSDYMHNGQDRDVTLHFILKSYTRTFMDKGTGENAVQVLNIQTGLGVTGSGSYRFRGYNGTATVDADESMTPAEFFGPNQPLRTTAATS